MKKKVEKKKELSRGSKIILYSVLVFVALVVIFNLGKPSVGDEGFFDGILKSLGLMSSKSTGSSVTPCTGSGDCAECTEKCGQTGYCISTGKKVCTKKTGSGDIICKKDECPCSHKEDNEDGSNPMCDSCTEYCKDTWGADECYPLEPAMKECFDGRCIKETEMCSCESDSDCEDCQKCGGSSDNKCKSNTEKYTICTGGGCCPKKDSDGDELECCRKLTSADAACCKKTEECKKTSMLEKNFNYCGPTAESCVSPDYTCSSALGTICCDGGIYTKCGNQKLVVPTCTMDVGSCSEEAACEKFKDFWGNLKSVLCCAANEECINIEIKLNNLRNEWIKACVAVSCKTGETLCTGLGEFAEMTTCCNDETAYCYKSEQGVPSCGLI